MTDTPLPVLFEQLQAAKPLTGETVLRVRLVSGSWLEGTYTDSDSQWLHFQQVVAEGDFPQSRKWEEISEYRIVTGRELLTILVEARKRVNAAAGQLGDAQKKLDFND